MGVSAEKSNGTLSLEQGYKSLGNLFGEVLKKPRQAPRRPQAPTVSVISPINSVLSGGKSGPVQVGPGHLNLRMKAASMSYGVDCPAYRLKFEN